MAPESLRPSAGGGRWRERYRFIRLLAFWLACSMRDTLRITCREGEGGKDVSEVVGSSPSLV